MRHGARQAGIGKRRDRQRRDGEGQGPPGQREGQPREFADLRGHDRREDIAGIEQDTREGVQVAGQAHIGEKGDRRRSDQDDQCRQQPRRQRIVEDQPVHHQCQKDDPEDKSGRKEQPGNLDEAELRAGDRDDDIADRRNEPGRPDMDRLEGPVPDPVGDNAQRKHALTDRTDDPKRRRQIPAVRHEGGRQQQDGNGNRRKEGDPDRMRPFRGDRAAPRQRLGGIECRYDDHDQDRHGQNDDGDDRRGPERRLGGMGRQCQAEHAHDDGKERDRKILQPVDLRVFLLHDSSPFERPIRPVGKLLRTVHQPENTTGQRSIYSFSFI